MIKKQKTKQKEKVSYGPFTFEGQDGRKFVLNSSEVKSKLGKWLHSLPKESVELLNQKSPYIAIISFVTEEEGLGAKMEKDTDYQKLTRELEENFYKEVKEILQDF